MPIDAAKDRPVGDPGGLEPARERAHGADGRKGRIRDALRRAVPLLVALRAAQRHDEALVAPDDVAGVEGYELGAPEGPKPAQRKQRAIAVAHEPLAGVLEKYDELLVDHGSLLRRSRAKASADPGEDLRQRGVRPRPVDPLRAV